MSSITARRRVWGWMFFDWASQPYHTLLLTFIFAPYMRDLLGDGSKAQAVWGFGLAAGGLVIAVLGPVVGAIADQTGSRMRWIWISSALYVTGASVLWWAEPGNVNLYFVLTFFAIGVVGVDMATIFTNSMLPDLGTRREIGRISGNGWALGYLGGLIALVIMLGFFAEDARTGTTILGREPAFGLDPETREGTRFVGPFTAVWYIVFMIPFFLWVRDPKPVARPGAAKAALRQLWSTLKSLPSRKSLFAYLGASMLYRDALNGIYAFGGLYAAGVLGWQIVDVGQFGILAIVTGAVFAWVGGKADDRFGPKPVIVTTLTILTLVSVSIVFISRDRLFGFAVPQGSFAPDIAFYVLGAALGAAGGAMYSASRSMMVRQADPERMSEAFGLYAMSGKATAFLAPALVGIVTGLTGSQQLGILPIIILFMTGLALLAWVKRDGDRADP